MDELKYNTYDYWFHHPTLKQGGSHYKSEMIFNGFVKNSLSIPSVGYCVQMGVNTGHTLNLMKSYFGAHRTRGIDLYNFNKDEYVFELDINTIDYNIPIAYAENDIGDVKISPKDRLAGFKWAIKNLVPNGVLITTSDVANDLFGEDVNEIVKKHNCHSVRLDEYNNEPWARYMNEESIWNTISLMMVKKYT